MFKFIQSFNLKKIVFLCFTISLFLGCSTQTPNQQDTTTISFQKDGEGEYDIIVLDTGYETYLKSIAKPKSYYSKNYYKNKNQRYILNWNLRVSQPFRYDSNLYFMRIDYDPNVNYGLHLEYKLYNFFQFFEWKYKVNLEYD